MKLITLSISGNPTPWSSPRLSRTGKSYSPKYHFKLKGRSQIQKQYRRKPIEGAVSVVFEFYMKMPKVSNAMKQMMLNGLPHIKKPDTTNLQKFAEDCLKGIVIKDDSQVVQVSSSKCYSDKPHTIIKVQQLTENKK